MENARGATLVELLLAAGVVATLAGLSLPRLNAAVQRAHSAGAKAALVDTVATSIQRAVIADSRSVICPSVDGQRCGDGFDWSTGWIAFLDEDGDRDRSASEPVFRRQDALPAAVRIRSSSGRSRIVFQSSGGNAGSNVTFRICDGRGPASAESFVLNNRGGLRLSPLTGDAALQACAP